MDTATRHSVKPIDTPMAAVDHAWLRMDSPVSPMVINSVMTFKTPISHDVFVKRLLEKSCPLSVSNATCRFHGE